MTISNHNSSNLTVDRLYNPYELTGQVIQYKAYFDKFVTEFGANYEIWIREDNFGKLAAGIVNRNLETPIAVTIWLKYNNAPLPYHPLSPTVIEAARNHLMSSTEDLQINYPLEVEKFIKH